MIAYEYILTRFERDIGIEGDGACVYSAARVMDRSTPMNVESGFSISLWTLNTVEVVWRVPGRNETTARFARKFAKFKREPS